MTYETKVLLALLSESIGRAKSVREAYNLVVKVADVEDVKLPSYDDFLQNIEEERRLA
ncbi:MAG: hypothetical protein FWE21_10605 [Defluviitaleaceae bacterium]|nr:hypothetical protein [Defluviitaleaceae bacterium]